MQTDNRFLDDLAKFANSALGTLHGVREEIETMVRQRVERLVAELDLVPREEFDMVREMATRAREENEALAKRVAELETKLARKTKAKKSTAKKPAAKD
ncbi:MAG: accessory factor UbiK family protein [Sphingomonadales bacterium]